jgi:flagellar biosynthesis activator protein FlaF
MSIDAYLRTTQALETPQGVEQRALQLANRRLSTAQSRGDCGTALVEALQFNRELWRTLADDCALSGNGLPPGLRASIISLSLWVNRHSSEVAARRESITPLIEVNNDILEGLIAQRRNAVQVASAA